jgi:ribosomal protein S18 acetylase RimI-like enzyme
MPALGNIIRLGEESARVCAWRADGSVALLVPVLDGLPPSAAFVTRCRRVLAEQGYRRVVTGALSPREQRGFLEAGFGVHEHLHLLVLDKAVSLATLPPGPRLHRAGWIRKAGLLEVDSVAFSAFWRLDRAGLQEALWATPKRRLRVTLGPGRKVNGYAICGAAGGRGFVQRLAVSPASQGLGIGRRLLLDGLLWLRGLATYEIAVNTQEGNAAALGLYHSVGFRDDPAGLCVLSADLAPAEATGPGAAGPGAAEVM